ncbi:hypothetical protein TorRG33x02_023530 [Trema orientale]|uniref:Uncharacterized protein n=1 Tax=Trema orientale TaxID=63057 RepID=A0A2P5FUW1_TREOI|nr:hypothetical protein TorRG33x02_023530 [Trema orientale]
MEKSRALSSMVVFEKCYQIALAIKDMKLRILRNSYSIAVIRLDLYIVWWRKRDKGTRCIWY